MHQISPPLLPQTPPPITALAAGQPTLELQNSLRFENEKKSGGIAFVLCILLGGWGAHRFYMKRPHAVTMLVITIVSIPLCLVFVGFFGLLAMWIWMIVDLFSVSSWVKEYNTALLARITTGR